MVRVVRGKHASSRLSKKRRQRQFQYMRAHASGAIVGTGSDNDAHAWQAVAAAAAADEVKIDLERGPLHDYYFARDKEGEQVRTQSEPEQSPVKVLQLTGDGVVHDPKGHLKARKVRW
jgi:riboflavin biosynthesis pyrimidine reductase